MHEQSMNPISPKKGRLRYYAKSSTVRETFWQILGLIGGDREMGTAISCTKCSQMAGPIHTTASCTHVSPSGSFQAAEMHCPARFAKTWPFWHQQNEQPSEEVSKKHFVITMQDVETQ